MKKFFTILVMSIAFFGFSTTSFAMADDGPVIEEPVNVLLVLDSDLNCETWQAPGWLDEQGNPTGCVDNAPCPEARENLPCPADIPAVEPVIAPVTPSEAPVTPLTPIEVLMEAPVEAPLLAPVTPSEEVTLVVETAPVLQEIEPTLAETGFDAPGLLLITSMLIGSGILLTVAAFRAKNICATK